MQKGMWPKDVLLCERVFGDRICNISDSAAIGRNVKVYPNVWIGENVTVGRNTIIQYGAFIEHDCEIGKHCRVGTNAVLRRETHIGDFSIFGSLSASEGKNWIGNHVLIHSQCHLTSGLTVEDWVFIAPLFVGANDPDMLHGRLHVKSFVPQAPKIGFASAIGANVTVLPNVVIGKQCKIGAGSVVTQDIPDYSVAYGVPARVIRKVEKDWLLPENV